ncbi:MAG TPA: hypothetical protein VEX11_17030 [Acetobacteraceae bacterium]|nr:hypothetical protein [Acetobacteraceae bacterium]
MTITLTPAEWDALELHAAARGLRPSEAARGPVVTMLRDPAMAEAPSVASDPVSLAAAAASLERSLGVLAKLLPSAEALARTEEPLTEIAEAVGTVAGAVVPLEPEPDTFGLRRAGWKSGEWTACIAC